MPTDSDQQRIIASGSFSSSWSLLIHTIVRITFFKYIYMTITHIGFITLNSSGQEITCFFKSV